MSALTINWRRFEIQLLRTLVKKLENRNKHYTKYIHCFQKFKHRKQQQHQINTLAHKYGENSDIHDVVDPK